MREARALYRQRFELDGELGPGDVDAAHDHARCDGHVDLGAAELADGLVAQALPRPMKSSST